VILGGLVALTVFLIYHFAVHTIRNDRPLGGVNVRVTQPEDGAQSEAAFAVDPAHPQVLFGASNELLTYSSTTGGRSWRRGAIPTVHEPACPRGEPKAVAGANREFLAFLVAPSCGDKITAYLVVTSRPYATSGWSPVRRVAPATWRFGFDDAPSFAIDRRNDRLYLSWTRGTGQKTAAVVVSSSGDGGTTWSPPVTVAPAANEPHLSSIAVGPTGAVYVAGIDAKNGIWIARSTNGGRTFGAPRTAAPLRANPSAACAGQSSFSPLPSEETSCIGADPTVVATKQLVAVVYGDVGANRTPDVYVAGFDPALSPLFHAQVNPPDKSPTQQFFPVATADPSTGALWACWYDTTFDPHAHRAWFTCSASRNGRVWTPPERAAGIPTQAADLFTDLGSSTGFSPAVVAAHGVAHPFWIDVNPVDFAQDISTAALDEHAAFVTLQR
jgi:hypothetical protein